MRVLLSLVLVVLAAFIAVGMSHAPPAVQSSTIHASHFDIVMPQVQHATDVTTTPARTQFDDNSYITENDGVATAATRPQALDLRRSYTPNGAHPLLL